jgi:hypothetical protein
LALVSAVIFVGVLAPYIAAQVRGVTIGIILSSGWSLGLWASAVAASTISIVASVGFAQKIQAAPRQRTASEQSAKPSETSAAKLAEIADCPWCHRKDFTYAQRSGHIGKCKLRENGHEKVSVK